MVTFGTFGRHCAHAVADWLNNRAQALSGLETNEGGNYVCVVLQGYVREFLPKPYIAKRHWMMYVVQQRTTVCSVRVACLELTYRITYYLGWRWTADSVFRANDQAHKHITTSTTHAATSTIRATNAVTIQEPDCTQLPRVELRQTTQRGSGAIKGIRRKKQVDVKGPYVHASLTRECSSSRFRPARDDKPLWTDGGRILHCPEAHNNVNRGPGFVSPTLYCQVSRVMYIADAATPYMSIMYA